MIPLSLFPATQCTQHRPPAIPGMTLLTLLCCQGTTESLCSENYPGRWGLFGVILPYIPFPSDFSKGSLAPFLPTAQQLWGGGRSSSGAWCKGRQVHCCGGRCLPLFCCQKPGVFWPLDYPLMAKREGDIPHFFPLQQTSSCPSAGHRCLCSALPGARPRAGRMQGRERAQYCPGRNTTSMGHKMQMEREREPKGLEIGSVRCSATETLGALGNSLCLDCPSIKGVTSGKGGL